MVEAWEKVGGNLVAAEEVPAERTSSYGIIDPGATDGALTEVRGLVEKPEPGRGAVAAGRDRPIHPPARGDARARRAARRGAGGEIQLTDALAKLIGTQPFHALKVDAVRHDCGDTGRLRHRQPRARARARGRRPESPGLYRDALR